jgi:leucyl/phenylalanyl-tRNA--protein transferase
MDPFEPPPPDEDWAVLLGRRPVFPPHESARTDGLLALGGDLTPDRLLAAYCHGVFPWYEAGEPILWWSPDPRLILEPEQLRIARSLRSVIRKRRFTITFDRAFRAVIHGCAIAPRAGAPGTWIHAEVETAYTTLHTLGYAHSVEVWESGTLAGGLYGVMLGRCFFGESMFSLQPNASKVALVALAQYVLAQDVQLIDCQVTTEHLLSLGAHEVPRAEFLRRLATALAFPTDRRPWCAALPDREP